ncbi:conserved hypothetical protein [Candida dubliniensis CD36]|uniref:Uncharacterized protein n=1 Tax=Candida dubliniensis (strain CD36 / ATCC MYA-646 / CBS 7987 / NCPF 3949 / NRRL Y-17841) TaxID=573826 RepID=B9WF20_CANDC|nr:conserved hypothetical protein [Candida dubliniensis CD36]CAX42476.1 conserved hypothetical protein [Candida dubliniensis CD36]
MNLLLLFFPIYVLATIHKIELYVNSANQEINGHRVSYRTGKFPSYDLYIDDQTSFYQYDDAKKVIYYDNKVRFYLTVINNILQLSPNTPLSINIQPDGKILDNTYAVESSSIAEASAKKNYNIWYGTDPPIDAIPLSIHASYL